MSKSKDNVISLKNMDSQQLAEILSLKRREMLNIRFQIATGQSQRQNVQKRSLRRFIARVKTEQNNRRHLSLEKS
jgi:ribosomal protein L29